MELSSEDIKTLADRLTQIHDYAVAARDRAQSAIIEVRQTKQWLTVLQIRASQAELGKPTAKRERK